MPLADSAFDQVLSILREEVGDAAARRVAVRLCAAFAGDRVYFPIRLKLEPVTVEPTDVPRTVQQKTGVSRTTAWRMVKKFRI